MKNLDQWARETGAPEFTPVRLKRIRHDGWAPARQRGFIAALSVTGTVAAAAQMVGMTRMSAYNLRKRAGAASFAEAWDIAIDTGRVRVFDALFDRALNGVTTIRLRLGGAVDISHGPDGALLASALAEPPPKNTNHTKVDRKGAISV